MFAKLTYGAGATMVHVMEDISTALTGGVISSMSASLNKPVSTLTSSANSGGAATWTFLANSTSILTDGSINSTGVTPVVHSMKVFKQSATTSFGTQEKFIKIGLFSWNNSTTIARFINFVGKSQSNGVLSGTCKGSLNTVVGSISAGAFTKALQVLIYSSPSATMISIAEGDLFSHVTCFTVFDFARSNPDMNLAGNLCTIAGNGQIASLHIPETTVDGKLWGDPTVTTPAGNRTVVSVGTPLINRVGSILENTLAPIYKFADFSTVGTKYDLLNIGVTKFDFFSGETQASVAWTDHVLDKQIHYSSITDVSGVYGCHINAFGKSGAFYQTALGTMCKFGTFMVKV